MAEVKTFDILPENLTYPLITPILFAKISFYQVMLTYHNASGTKAYIMNMYTNPDYRRKRIAFKMLDLLVKEAKERGIKQISLEATEEGKLLYKKYGFTQMQNEWEFQSE